jgi:hypothetical protein
MTTKILSGIIIVLLVLNLLLFKQIEEVSSHGERINQSSMSQKTENENYKKVIGFFYEKEGVPIRNHLYTTDTGIKKELVELLDEETTLVFSYSSNDCSDCINGVLEQIKESGYNARILIISDYDNIASMNYLKKKYLFPNAHFLKIAEQYLKDTPAVFLLNKEMKISKFLAINKNDNILGRYLDNILE